MTPRAIAFGGLVGLMSAAAGASYAQPPVRIDSVSADVEITGGLARSKVTYVLSNPTDRDDEGIFELELPPDAALLRLAMDTRPGQMMEGEIATPERAREIYETIVARRLDPALVEHVSGDVYRLRAFPVPARGRKTVLLVFDHRVEEVAGRLRYRLRLPISGGEPARVRRASAIIRSAGRVRARIRRSATAAPLEASWRARRSASVVTTRVGGETRFVAELRLPGTAEPGWRHLVALVDTSSSVAAIDRQRAREVLARLIAATPRGGSIDLVHGSTSPRRCAGREALHCLDRHRSRGATDLGRLLDDAASIAAARGPDTALVILSDGIPSVGVRSVEVLGRRLGARLARAGLDLAGVELGREPAIAGLIEAAGGRVAAPSPRAVLAALTPNDFTDLQVGGGHVLSARAAPAGSIVSVAGALRGERRSGVIEVSGWRAGRQHRWRLPIDESIRSPSVEGIWVRARLLAMKYAGAKDEELAAFAKQHGVAGIGSSMLVLETEEDYARWGVARTQGLVVSRRTAAPRVVIHGCGVSLSGDIDKNMIRRAVRRAHRGLRHCYNRALMRRPDLAGTVVGRFLIKSWTGELAASQIASSDVGDARFEACIAARIDELRFPPAKGGGLVAVSYPFRFNRSTTAAERAIARRERIPEIEAGEVSARRPRETGELVGLYVAAGEPQKAAAALRSLERQLRAAGRPRSDLLAALSTPALRRRFAATFREAARDRLRRPSPPADLALELFESDLAGDPGDPDAIVADFGAARIDAGHAARMIERLIRARRVDIARALVTSWRRRRLFGPAEAHEILAAPEAARAVPDLVFEAAVALAKTRGRAARDAFDALVATANTSRRRALAARLVARHCQAIEDSDDPCLSWLDRLAPDPAAASHGDALLRRRLATLTANDRWNLLERAAILERLGREADSLAIVAEELEADPDNEDIRDRYLRLRTALRKR